MIFNIATHLKIPASCDNDMIQGNKTQVGVPCVSLMDFPTLAIYSSEQNY